MEQEIRFETSPAPAKVAPGATTDSAMLAQPIAGWTLGEGLAAAVAAGTLLELGEGRWRLLDPDNDPSVWMSEFRDANRKCWLYNSVLFQQVYRESVVPLGCAGCFKVKAAPRTLRELMALRKVLHALPYTYKCGLDASVSLTSDIYGAYLYLNSLAAARAAYHALRAAVDADPLLGPAVPVSIKRGCTNYEVKCGPSDQYRFSAELAPLEAWLRKRVERPPGDKNPVVERLRTFALWIETAYRLGDETYLDFTHGRRLFPQTVKYDPDGVDAPVCGVSGGA